SRSKTIPPDTSWVAATKSLMSQTADSASEPDNIDAMAYGKPLTRLSDKPKGELFYFDPNVLSFEGWRKLGIREKTASTIQNYLHKGGHFYKAEDLKKIYGVHADEYTRLEPYIRIATSEERITTMDPAEPPHYKAESKKETVSGRPKLEMV